MTYDVKIQRKLLNALFDIKGSIRDVKSHLKEHIKSFPIEPNSYISEGNWKILYVGPNHWILMAPIAEEEALVSSLRPYDCPASISIVLISDTLTFFCIDGPDAFDIMSIASSLNLNADVFTPQTATFSDIFGLKALIIRDGDGYQFAVDQSFGEMVSNYLDLTLAN